MAKFAFRTDHDSDWKCTLEAKRHSYRTNGVQNNSGVLNNRPDERTRHASCRSSLSCSHELHQL